MISILVVDDQAVVRTGLRTLLEAEPDLRVVAELDDGFGIVETVQQHAPDVVLMDVRMPRMNGIEATRALAEQGVAAKVCVLTTYGVDDYVFDALAAGAGGFLLKTDTPERIIATVRSVAAGENALGAEVTRALVERFVAAPSASGADREAVESLTAREREVLGLVAEGLSNAEIAGQLVVGEGTVKTHMARILMKLGLRDRTQAAIFAHRAGVAGRAT
jgi:DNA-binding NarL/FixJ family response regulator